MKLISWNVNGLRACVGKGFLDFVDFIDADVILSLIHISEPTRPNDTSRMPSSA